MPRNLTQNMSPWESNDNYLKIFFPEKNNILVVQLSLINNFNGLFVPWSLDFQLPGYLYI